MGDAHLFISDLHLAPETPRCAELLLRFLGREACDAAALYILGDLFDAWIGDDAPPEPAAAVTRALHALTMGGTAVYLMHGNRDFLLGADFAAATGVNLVDDPLVIDLNGTPTLLTHGDLLCTDDRDYLAFRAQVRNVDFIAGFLDKAPAERLAIAREYRRKSGEAVAGKEAEIMDVNPQEVANWCRRHRVRRLIHGHTHRPGFARFELDGKPAERWTLGAWSERGGLYLRAGGDGIGLRATGPLIS